MLSRSCLRLYSYAGNFDACLPNDRSFRLSLSLSLGGEGASCKGGERGKSKPVLTGDLRPKAQGTIWVR